MEDGRSYDALIILKKEFVQSFTVLVASAAHLFPMILDHFSPGGIDLGFMDRDDPGGFGGMGWGCFWD